MVDLVHVLILARRSFGKNVGPSTAIGGQAHPGLAGIKGVDQSTARPQQVLLDGLMIKSGIDATHDGFVGLDRVSD